MMDDSKRGLPGGIPRRRIDRRTFLEAAGAGTTAVTLAGCLDESTAEPAEDDPDRNGDEDSNRTDEDDGETADLDGPFRIGHLAPLENRQGIGSDRSARLAAEEINADGGLLGAAVEVHSADTRADPSTAQEEVARLINQEDVDLLVGTFANEVTLNILDMVAENDVPSIVTGAASPLITERSTGSNYERYKNVFRSGPINSEFQAEAMADYADFLADEHGWTSFAFLADDAQWTTPFETVLPDELRARGYDVVYDGLISTEIGDFGPVIDGLVNEDPDALFRFFAHIVGTDLLGAWQQSELEFGIEGIHVASMVPEFYELTHGVAGFETTAQAGAGGTSALTPTTLEFVERYRSFVDVDGDAPALPMEMGFNTYDAIHLYREAVERAGTADYERDLDDIVDAMLGLEYTGTAGTISFFDESAATPHDVRPTRDGTGAIANYPVTQWQPDGLECVYPRSVATAPHLAPPWM